MMKKRMIFFITIVLLLVLFVPNCFGSMTVRAADSDFTIENGVLTKYNGSGGDVVIPDGVTSIGHQAFFGCKSMTSVTIPDSVVNLSYYSFDHCSGLKSITIPKNVAAIGHGVFRGCTLLSKITVSSQNTHFKAVNDALLNSSGTRLIAFAPASQRTSFAIPDTVEVIETHAFEDCANLKNISIPDSVKVINISFGFCTGLEKIAIPKSVTSISQGAFDRCSHLSRIDVDSDNSVYSSYDGVLYNKIKTILICCPNGKQGTVTIPDTVFKISSRAFENCQSLTGVTIPDSVTNIEIYSFSKCISLKSLTIPDSVTSIGSLAFCGCSSLSKVILPNTLSKISSGVFYGCSSLNTVTIPDSVTAVEDLAFKNCNSLMQVTFSDSMTSIDETAFSGCYQLSDVFYSGSSQQWSSAQLGNAFGSDVTVHYNYIFSITTQPSDKTIYLGDSLTLSLKASGEGLTYQWYFRKKGQTSFSVWNGHTHASEAVTPNATWNGIQLYCIVKDKYNNSCKSQTVTVAVRNKLQITAQPVSKTVTLGNSLTLSLKASGDGLTYQWYFRKTGATSFSKWNNHTHASEAVTPNASWNGIQLYCIVKDKYNHSIQSNTVSVTVNSSLAITRQPESRTVSLGETIILSLSATGKGLTYQWYYKKTGAASFSKWNNHTHASEAVAPNATWDGIQLYCIVRDSFGNSVRSDTVRITVYPELAITRQPEGQIITLGDSLTVSLKAVGAGLQYQWYYRKAGQNSFAKWSGRTHASETVTPNATWNGIQLYCEVKDSSGNSVQSNVVKITVDPPITITRQSGEQVAAAGEKVTFFVSATGRELTYQWYYKKANQSSWNKWNDKTAASISSVATATWNGMFVHCVIKDHNGNTLTSSDIKVKIV